MRYIDMHCDTILKKFQFDSSYSMIKNDACVDFEKLKAGGAAAQFFAIFMIPREEYEQKYNRIYDDLEYIKVLRSELIDDINASNDAIRLCTSYSDLMKNLKEDKLSAMLSIEDSRAVDGKFENIKLMHDLGFRLMSLTWNFKNCFGSPNSKDPAIMAEGLTKFGKEGIQYMNELGIIIDVSHLSDGGFWDVVEITKKPFVASHSNARALSGHTRNLTDEMIRALANKGGVTGLNFCGKFLNENIEDSKSRLSCMIEHIKHIVNVGGIDVMGLGGDFDGIGGELEIYNSAQMPVLFDAIKKAGFSESDIDKITFENVARVIKENE